MRTDRIQNSRRGRLAARAAAVLAAVLAAVTLVMPGLPASAEGPQELRIPLTGSVFYQNLGGTFNFTGQVRLVVYPPEPIRQTIRVQTKPIGAFGTNPDTGQRFAVRGAQDFRLVRNNTLVFTGAHPTDPIFPPSPVFPNDPVRGLHVPIRYVLELGEQGQVLNATATAANCEAPTST